MIGLVRFLFWNWIVGDLKGTMMSQHRSLQEAGMWPTLGDAAFLVHEAPCFPLNASLEGELVHVTCPVNYNGQPLGDDDPLLYSTPAESRVGLKLEAYMAVFQWEEYPYSKKVGKRTVRDHLYFREWHPMKPPRNESFFGDARRCIVDNGGRDCYQWNPAETETWWNSSRYELDWAIVDIAQNITIGESYVLPDSDGLIDNIAKLLESPQAFVPTCVEDGNSNNDEQGGPCGAASLQDDSRTIAWQQLDSDGESIDYLTRYYNLYTLDTLSVLAVQRGNSFVPWEYEDGKSLFEFAPGGRTATQMIEAAKSSAPDGRIGVMVSLVGLVLMVVLG